jgi:oxalate decarboxylase/phosphoglucose isomerase-like protein (cupin superfamily)
MIEVSKDNQFKCQINRSYALEINSQYKQITTSGASMQGFTDHVEEYKDFNYRVYRYLYDDLIDNSLNVKYDLTLLPAFKGKKCIARTRGHFHLCTGCPPVQYFDIYQVVKGQILFQIHLLPAKAKEAYFIEGREGDILILPPEMCHVLYNIGNQTALLSNWCTRKEHLDYDTMKNTNGPAFDIFSFQEDKITVKKNKNILSNEIKPVLLIPKKAKNILQKLGCKSEYILDWAFEGDVLNIMNNPSFCKNYLEHFFDDSKKLTISITSD